MQNATIFQVLAILAATASIVTAADTDWPQFRGPTGQGTSSAKKTPVTWSSESAIRWKTKLPGAGTSSPIVFGNKIFLSCYSGYNVPGEQGEMDDLKLSLACFDRASGKLLWNTSVAPRLPEQETIRDEHGYASGTPAADAERVYVSFGKTGLFAFDHAGKRLWQAELGDGLNGWGSSASPVIYKNLVIVNACVESDSLMAFEKTTGKPVWRAKGINESWNTPILVATADGKTELVVAIMSKVLGYDPLTGEQLWSCATDIPWYMVPSLVASDGIVYAVGGRNGGGALAVRTGGRGEVTQSHRLWTLKQGSNVTSPIYSDGHLYWMNDVSGIAFCANAKTGKLVYEQRVPRADQIYPSPILADGKIYYLGRGGRTFVVAAKPEFELLATNDLEPRGIFNASPAVSGNELLIRSNAFLYCLGGSQ